MAVVTAESLTARDGRCGSGDSRISEDDNSNVSQISVASYCCNFRGAQKTRNLLLICV